MKTKEEILHNLMGYVQNGHFHIRGDENSANEQFWLSSNGFKDRKEFQEWVKENNITERSGIGCGGGGCCLGIFWYLTEKVI